MTGSDQFGNGTVREDYGHRFTEKVIELPNESKQVLRCVECGISVDPGHPEQLAQYDCEQYENVRAAINGGGAA